jgi:hypothetical protein
MSIDTQSDTDMAMPEYLLDNFRGDTQLFCVVPRVTVASPLRQSLPTIAEIAR